MPGPTDDVISRRDVDFLLYEWLHVEDLTQRPRFTGHDRDVYDSVLDLYRSIALEQFLLSTRAQERIRDFRIPGASEPVFVPMALDAHGDGG